MANFRDLPPELRIQIWNLLIEPRVITVRQSHSYPYNFYSLCRTPIILQICRESRYFGLHFYHHALGHPVSHSPISNSSLSSDSTSKIEHPRPSPNDISAFQRLPSFRNAKSKAASESSNVNFKAAAKSKLKRGVYINGDLDTILFKDIFWWRTPSIRLCRTKVRIRCVLISVRTGFHPRLFAPEAVFYDFLMGVFDIGGTAGEGVVAGKERGQGGFGREGREEREGRDAWVLGIVSTEGVKAGRILGMARMDELSRGWGEVMLGVERGNEEARHFFRWVGKRKGDEGVILRVVDGRVVRMDEDEDGD